MTSHLFSSLDLRDELVSTTEALGFKAMTSIQQQSLPLILSGDDVIAQGHTGSGKTAAFGVGVLNALDVTLFKPQALVLCPTRELSEQVASEVRRLARSIPNVKVITVYGGTPIKAQMDSLSKGAHIVVGTPGRIEDLMAKNSLDLAAMRTLVLDEADRMLDMGFQKTLDTILEMVPAKRQTLLFSATFPKQIEELVQRVTKNAELVKVSAGQDQVRIDERFYEVGNDKARDEALALLLLEQGASQAVVFCNTRVDAQAVAGGLKSSGFSAAALHGDMEQKDRDQTLIRFSNGSLNILVATDVAKATHFDLPPQQLLGQTPTRANMSTLRIEGGKKQKLRPGDLVGALTKGDDINGDQLGKIQMMDNWAYIAIERGIAKQALQKLSEGRIKGKSFRCRLI